jgi:uncharacterized phage protein (TIGR02218 family)
VFDGMTFAPESGLSARALASSTGLSVDNSEAIGVLSADAITEADIFAGRYDGAEVLTWTVCWDDVSVRQLRFRGKLGEITRSAGGFQAELLGLTEALNQPQGRAYLKTCSAVLGDTSCRFVTNQPAYQLDYVVVAPSTAQSFLLPDIADYHMGWFEHGQLEVRSGAATGLRALIKSDVGMGADRCVTLWAPISAPIVAGDRIRLTAGCDKRAETCRVKFDNFLNFQGFPDIPGDDWLVSVPRSDQSNSGRSRSR